MPANEIRKGDSGVTFKVTISDGTAVKDLSAYTTKKFIFKKPGETLLTVDASFYTDGTDGILTYTSSGTDLNEVGLWKLQARLASTGTDKRTDIATFRVNEILE